MKISKNNMKERVVLVEAGRYIKIYIRFIKLYDYFLQNKFIDIFKNKR